MSKFSFKEFPIERFADNNVPFNFNKIDNEKDNKMAFNYAPKIEKYSSNFNYESSSYLREFIKNAVGQNENEITPVAYQFFSDKNIELINKEIVLIVFEKSNKMVKIPFQSRDDLLVVMRSIFLKEAKNCNTNINKQVYDLNKLVINDILPSIVSNVEQYVSYIKELKSVENQERKINDLPVSTKMTRGTIELPPMTDVYFGK